MRVDRAIARRSAKGETEKLYRTLNQRLVLSRVRELAHAETVAQQRAQLATRPIAAQWSRRGRTKVQPGYDPSVVPTK